MLNDTLNKTPETKNDKCKREEEKKEGKESFNVNNNFC